MRLLLDTNVFVRWIAGTPLPRSLERVLASKETDCLISIVSCWEIVMKPQLGCNSNEIRMAIEAMGASMLPIRFNHLSELSGLPAHAHHRDPFDRMLIAQAFGEDVPIATSDMRFSEYNRLRVVWD